MTRVGFTGDVMLGRTVDEHQRRGPPNVCVATSATTSGTSTASWSTSNARTDESHMRLKDLADLHALLRSVTDYGEIDRPSGSSARRLQHR